ncbi:MAG: hypothetical protein ABSD74_03505 [Rhizomicrobium sp.]
MTAVGAIFIAAIIISNRPPAPPASSLSVPSSQAVSSMPAESAVPVAPGSLAEAQDPTNLAMNKDFQAKYPGYVEEVRKLIVASGHMCDTLAFLWTKGDSPYGTRLEAQCGPDATAIMPSQHYAVYPEKLKVDVCEKIGAVGKNCE